MLSPETLNALTAKVSELVADLDGNAEVTQIRTTEVADGSGRWCCIVHLCDGQEEATWRVAAPAPDDAPAWAPREFEIVEVANR